jgi:hypothetical protein
MTNNESRGPFARRGFLAAAVVVGIIVLAAIVVLITSIGRGSNSATSKPSYSPTSSAPVVKNSDKSICGLSGFGTRDTLSGAPSVHWVLVGTIAAPTASSAGPGKIVKGLRTCYAHTAEGALVMATNFIAMGSDATLGPRLVSLVAPGPGRNALESKPSTSTSSSEAQVAGYKIGAYNRSQATVEIVMNYSDGSLVSIPLKLVWSQGDWKVVLTDSGDFPLAPAQIQDLGGYTPWAGA